MKGERSELETAPAEGTEGGDRTTPFRAWRRRQGFSVHEASRRLGVPYTVVRGVDGGAKVPNLRTAAKLVYGSGGDLTFDDFLPPKERYALKRRYHFPGRPAPSAPPRKAVRRRAQAS